MPPRKEPTVRQCRLGSELRKIRQSAGLSIAQAAPMLATDRTTVSNTESGRFGVSPERVRSWAEKYGCTDAAYVDALAAMAAERINGWWEDYRGELHDVALDLAELEYHAVAIRGMQIMHVPGLLQNENYIRAVYSEFVPPRSPARQRRLVSHRLKRRDVLDRENPPDCTFLIHEAALRMTFGGPEVLRGQLKSLLVESERDNVTILVIPFSAGGIPHGSSSAHYVYGPVPQLDTVQTDTPTGSGFVDAELRLSNWRAVLDRAEEKALDPQQSRDFIDKVAQQI
ncbi:MULTISPECIES: Scr1 family TA system antitoxin-like transcriptional regulator [unclassified Streptomyces]|uniref:Scr1 family TA system antitoxin-like transcriptional regulator n=1 Tax=unclassified Streptomyces TaxID=2593676 RepID=UPI0037FE7F44